MPLNPTPPSRAALHHSVERQGDMEVRGANDWYTIPRIDITWPVGSIYFTKTHATADAVAEALGGGTWEQIAKGQFIVGQDSTKAGYETAGANVGSDTHTHAAPAAHNLNLTHSGTAVADHAAHDHGPGTTVRVQSIGTVGQPDVWSDSDSAEHPAMSHSVTQPSAHTGSLTHGAIAAANNVPLSLVLYVWERTA